MATADLPTLALGPPTLSGLFQTLFLPFLKEGVVHILTGYDHLLFLLGLLVVCPRTKTMLGLVTTFTLAHSLTLAFSATGVWVLSPRVAEPLIALTLCLVAAANITGSVWSKPPPPSPRRSRNLSRWPIVFIFGLIHGFGFAAVLRETMPPDSRLIPLLAFNLGVEVGQISVVAATFPLLLVLRQRPGYRWVVFVSSLFVGFAGLIWLALRIF